MLQMGDTSQAYSMFLGRPWLMQVKVHHDWGNNTLTIIVDIKTMTLGIKKQVMVHPSQKPCNLDDIYDWEIGLRIGDEERLYHVILELWPIGEVSPKELKFIPKVCVRMVQPKDNINYPFWYYQHEPKETLILDEFTNITIKNEKITGWTFNTNEQLSKLNVGINEEPHIMLVRFAIPEQFQVKVKQLLIEFKDVFAWSYK